MSKPTTPEWEKRFELARRRLSPVIDLDRNPPVKFTAVSCEAALAELRDLRELFSKELERVRQEEIKKYEHDYHMGYDGGYKIAKEAFKALIAIKKWR